MSAVTVELGEFTDTVVSLAVQLLMVVPVGAVSTMFTSCASLGPLLVTVIVYSTDSPLMSSVWPVVLVTFTVTLSACGSGVTVGVSQLSLLLFGPAVSFILFPYTTLFRSKSGGVCTVTV